MRILFVNSYDDTLRVEQISGVCYDSDLQRMYLENIFNEFPDKYIEDIEYDEYVKLAGELLLNGYLDLTEYTVSSDE